MVEGVTYRTFFLNYEKVYLRCGVALCYVVHNLDTKHKQNVNNSGVSYAYKKINAWNWR